MSRQNQKEILTFDQFQHVPGTDVAELKLFDKPTGLNFATNLNRISYDDLIDCNNLLVTNDGQYTNSYFVDGPQGTIGSAGVNDILGMYAFKHPEYYYIIAVTQTSVYYRTTGTSVFTYTQLTGPTFTGLVAGEKISFVTWGDRILFTNPIIGLHEINLSAGTYTKITSAPTDAQFVTVVAGRVVLCGMTSAPRRVKWSVKFSNTDWTGLGSGYEDLGPISDTSVNYPMRVLPISDVEALVVRLESIDLMSSTDRFDVPFTFSQRHTGIGTTAPFACVTAQQGIIVAGHGNYYYVTRDSFQAFGDNLIAGSRIVPTISPMVNSFAMYNSDTMEYWFCQGENSYDGYTNSRFWVYNFKYKSWTMITMPGIVRALVSSYSRRTVRYSEVSGAITYAAYGSTPIESFGTYIADNTRDMFVSIANSDYYMGTYGATTWTLMSRDITGPKLSDSITVVDMSLAYDAGGSFDVDYSLDFGTTWTNYATVTAPATNQKRTEYHITTLNKTITGSHIRFRLNRTVAQASATRFNLYELIVRIQLGARSFYA